MNDLRFQAKQLACDDFANGRLDRHQIGKATESYFRWLSERRDSSYQIRHDNDGNDGGRFD